MYKNEDDCICERVFEGHIECANHIQSYFVGWLVVRRRPTLISIERKGNPIAVTGSVVELEIVKKRFLKIVVCYRDDLTKMIYIYVRESLE